MSLEVFPAFTDTVLTQLPFAKTRVFRTSKVEMDCGLQFAYRHRTDALRSWTINCQHITDDELVILEDFFRARKGQLEAFTFTDPDDLYELKVRFDVDDFQVKQNGPDDNSVSLPIVEDRTP